MKALFRILILALFAEPAFAQPDVQKHTDINRNGTSFAVGVHTLNTGNRLYFNASGEGRGNQLYEYDGDQHLRITSFTDTWKNPEVKEKRQANHPLGATCLPLIEFEEKVFFFAKGELTPPGIYYHHNGITTQAYRTTAVGSAHAIFNDKLVCEVELGVRSKLDPKGKTDTLGRRIALLAFDARGKAAFFAEGRSEYKDCFADAMLVFNNELFLSKGGKIFSTTGKKVVADSRFNTFQKAAGLFLFHDRMYFNAEKEGKRGLYSYDKNGVFRYHGAAWPGKELIHSPDAVSDRTYYYFASSTPTGTGIFRMAANANAEMIGSMNFKGSAVHFESMVMIENQLFISMRAPGENSFNIFQWNKDTLIPIEVRYQYDLRNLKYFKDQLFFTAKSKADGSEYFSLEPIMPPKVQDYSFTISDYNKSGFKIGTIEAVAPDVENLSFEIVSGNEHEIFKVNQYTGVLSIERAHNMDTDLKKTYHLKVRVGNREICSYSNVTIQIKASVDFVFEGLKEKLLFFPDFSRKGVLTAENIPNGTVVNVYTIGQEMVDQLVVRDGCIFLGSYPTGIYILNIQGENNFYQRIEMQ
ncbi:MAG: cadherin repeat domain-containing protein [Flavobacteriales bacterium]|nr:cadherin repeat domain-containing protein [Flavobacteriales bacterium]